VDAYVGVASDDLLDAIPERHEDLQPAEVVTFSVSQSTGRLTFYYYNGIRRRPTKFSGRVVRAIVVSIGPAFARPSSIRTRNLRNGTAGLERGQRTANPSIVPLANECREGYV
jgi:hypothetical protein